MNSGHVYRSRWVATMLDDAPYGLVEDAAIATSAGQIDWVGPAAELPAKWRGMESTDFGSAGITPGLIDCHTHLVYAGRRAGEFEQRLLGTTYAEIAAAGGGIRSTVAATRAATEDELVKASWPRLRALLDEGVTTVEIKSGYGLDLASEQRMLRAARRLESPRTARIATTFLGAHAVPVEFDGRADEYVTEVVERMLPAVAEVGLADAVDAFCESIGFSLAQTERVLRAAVALGLPIKLHAEQLSDQKGAVLAAELGALSVDHLEYLDPGDAAALAGTLAGAGAGTVAVLLPGAFYFLRETQLPPIEALRAARVPIALATDCNPGSSPTTSPLLMMNMACVSFRMTPEEALAGFTRSAAAALGRANQVGTIAKGRRCDLAVWEVEAPGDLAYGMGQNPLRARILGGQTVDRHPLMEFPR